MKWFLLLFAAGLVTGLKAARVAEQRAASEQNSATWSSEQSAWSSEQQSAQSSEQSAWAAEEQSAWATEEQSAWATQEQSARVGSESANQVRRRGCGRRAPSIEWVRKNAENMLFLEYLQSEAAKGDLYSWRSLFESSDYKNKLESLRASLTTMSTDASEDCGIEREESTILDRTLLDRLSTLETRFASCGSNYECSSGCGSSNCEMYDQKLMVLQAELRRQRMMIQRLYSQIIVISSSSSSCGCENS